MHHQNFFKQLFFIMPFDDGINKAVLLQRFSALVSEGGSVVVVKLKKDFDSPYEHWAVVTALNDDNSISSFTSPAA